MTITAETLATIKVIWRQPDTMALWGIPHAMRPGQQPYDLWRARQVWRAPDRGGPLATEFSHLWRTSPEPKADWVWLGAPGWWGSMTAAEQALVAAWLARQPDLPSGPCEWVEAVEAA